MPEPTKNLRSFLVLPDDRLSGRDATESASSIGGKKVGSGIAGTTNEGNLGAFVSGIPTSTTASYRFRLQSSGGIRAGATYGWWHYDNETASDVRGANDIRFFHFDSDPFYSEEGPWSNSTKYGYGATGFASTRLGKEFVYVNGVAYGAIQVAYRDLSRVESEWTTSDVTLNIDTRASKYGFAGSVNFSMGIVELPDGGIRMCVTNDGNLDIFESADGITFDRIADNVLSRFADRQNTLKSVRMAESGGYLRICAVEYDMDSLDNYLTTLVSSDRGATWMEVSSLEIPMDNSVSKYLSGSIGFTFALIGLGDATGSFLLVKKYYHYYVYVYQATAHEGWVRDTDLSMSFGATTNIDQIWGARTSDYLYLLISDYAMASAGTTNHRDYALYRLDRRVSLDNQEWENIGLGVDPTSGYTQRSITGYRGSPAYGSAWGNVFDTGMGLAFFAGRFDYTYSAWSEGTRYTRLGDGWSKSPISDTTWEGYASGIDGAHFRHQEHGRLFCTEWNACFGTAVGSGTAFTEWTETKTGSGFGMITSNYHQFQTDPTCNRSFKWDDRTSGSPVVSWGIAKQTTEVAGSCIVWENSLVGSTYTTGATTARHVCGIRVLARGSSTGGYPNEHVDVEVRQSLHEVMLYDNIAGSTLATIRPSVAVYGSEPFGSRWEFRLSLCPRPANYPQLALLKARKWGTENWVDTDLLYLTRGAVPSASTRQFISFGAHASPIAGDVVQRWYGVRVHEYGDLRQAPIATNAANLKDAFVPHVIRGRECSPFRTLIDKGVRTAWGGGGGFDGDHFSSVVQYQYDPKNALLGSPQFEWRSETGTAPISDSSIIFGAGSSEFDRFSRHQAMSITGTNASRVHVEYSDDLAFSSPTCAGVLSLQRFGPFRVSAVEGRRMRLSGTNRPPDGTVQSSDGLDFYLGFSAVAAGATTVSVGDAFRIRDNRERWVEAETGSILSSVVGSSLYIYSDRGVLLYDSIGTTDYSKRYMRVTFEQSGPPSGYHKVGTIVAGTTLDLEVPLDWKYKDAQAANATTYRSRSGISWAYIEGPARRTVTGTIEGDISGFRERLRNLLRSTTQYAEYPMVLVRDDTRLTDPESVMLGKIASGLDFEQTGWRWSSASTTWVPVGDTSFQFEEEV